MQPVMYGRGVATLSLNLKLAPNGFIPPPPMWISVEASEQNFKEPELKLLKQHKLSRPLFSV